MEKKERYMIPITEEDLLDIERIWYEVKGYENIIHTMHRSSDPRYDYSKCVTYDKMMNRYHSVYAEFNLLYKTILDKYIDEELINNKNYSNSIDFVNSCIVIEFEEKMSSGCCHG